RLVSIRDHKNNETTISWDSLGRKRGLCDPDRGCSTFDWNDDDSQAAESDANGSTFRLTFDPEGRIAVQESFDPAQNKTRDVRFTWDVDPGLGGAPGASLGRLTRVDDTTMRGSALVSSYRFDALGRVDLSRSCVDSACFELATQ